MKNVIPISPSDEAKDLSWAWRWSHVYMLVPLMVVGSIYSILDVSTNPLYTVTSPFKLFSSSFAIYLLIWICVLLPSTCVRLCCKQRLNRWISVFLAFAGVILANSVMFSMFGSGFRGSLMLIFFLGSAYKVSRSYFGFYSIGIPIPFRGNLPLKGTKVKVEEISANQNTCASQNNRVCSLDNIETVQNMVQPIPIPESLNVSNVNHDELSAPAKRSENFQKTNETSSFKGLAGVTIYGVVLVVLVVYGAIHHSYQWDEDTLITSFGVPFLCIIVPWWCGDFIRKNFHKIADCYQTDKPDKSIAYAIIGIAFIGCWYYLIYCLLSLIEDVLKYDLEEYLFVMPIVLQVLSYVIVSKLKMRSS